MLARCLSLLVLAAALVAGCGGGKEGAKRAEPAEPTAARERCSAVPAQDGRYAGGRAERCAIPGGRSYVLFRPDGSRPRRILVGIHGVGGAGADPEGLVDGSHLDRLAAQLGAALAMPEGNGGSWNETGAADAPDDVAFVAAVIADARRRAGVRDGRALVAGWSGGGYMVHRLGCELSDRIAAIAALQAPLRGECRPRRAPAVLQIAGTADDVIPFRGGSDPLGGRTPAVEAATARWRRLAGCPAPSRRRSGRVIAVAAQGCETGGPVELLVVRGAGHSWYGPEAPPPDDALDASEQLRRFFARVTR